MKRALVIAIPVIGLGLVSTGCGGDDGPAAEGEGEEQAGEGEGEGGEGEGGEGEGEAGEGEGEVEPACGPDGIVHGDETVVEAQDDVAELAGCTEIEGSLLIRGHDVVDLGPLSSLVRVGGGLWIRGAIALRSLHGLEGITSVGQGLEVAGCDLLENLEGLDGVEGVGWGLEVASCLSLEKLEGLESLSLVASGVTITDNANLASLAALAGIEVGEGFEGIYRVAIRSNHSLRTLDGLEFLGSGGPTIDLGVSECDALDDLAALAGLEELWGLELRGNPSIASLEPLSSLRVAAQVQIEDLGVGSLDGLDGLTNVDWLSIRGNPALEDLSSLGSLEDVDELHVWENAAMRTLGELPSLASLRVLAVSDAPALASLGPSRLGSGALERLYLGGCPALVDLAALVEIDSVDDQLTIVDMDSLASLGPLDGIASVGQRLRILNNDVLPQPGAEAWASSRGAEDVKVDGNFGAEHHVESCPWTDDGECDEEGGTGLCPAGSDDSDCNWND